MSTIRFPSPLPANVSGRLRATSDREHLPGVGEGVAELTVDLRRELLDRLGGDAGLEIDARGDEQRAGGATYTVRRSSTSSTSA